jgi:hypothetical protein
MFNLTLSFGDSRRKRKYRRLALYLLSQIEIHPAPRFIFSGGTEEATQPQKHVEKL